MLALLLLVAAAACAPEETEPGPADELSSDTISAAPPAGLLMADPPGGALAVRDLSSAQPREPWEANVLFDSLVSDSDAIALLREYGALPYAVFGWTLWEHRLSGGPAAASEAWVDALRTSALRRARSVVCDGKGREQAGARALAGGETSELGEARARVAEMEEAAALLDALEAGEPILYALRVRAPAFELERMASDPRVARLEPAVHTDRLPVLPEVGPPTLTEGDSTAARFAGWEPRSADDRASAEELRSRARSLAGQVGCGAPH